MYYRRVAIVDGESVEPVHFVAFHPTAWMMARSLNSEGAMIEPTVAFVESGEVEKLLRKIRDALVPAPYAWDTYLFDVDERGDRDLINEIDALLGDEANG